MRDRLPVTEVKTDLPCRYKVHFLHPSKLHYFQLTVNPRIVAVLCFLIDESYYQGRKFV